MSTNAQGRSTLEKSSETDGALDDWTLVTVTYNSAAHLRESWGRASFGNARWIVVDNASTDDSVEVAESLGADVIRLPENVGFGAANNVGLAATTTKWVAFVNPDVTVSGPEGLRRLASVSWANGALIAPQLLNNDGSEQPNARGLPFLAHKFANRSVRIPGARLDDYVRTGLGGPTYCAWAIGAAIGGETDTFRELGGWDERYFIYYEDHDMGLRAWDAGFPVVVDPEVRWVHQWQRATKRLRWAPWKHELRSARRFYATYPELIVGRQFRAGAEWADVISRLWTSASGTRVAKSVIENPGPHLREY